MLDRILIGSSAEPSDPNFKNVTLLLHGDGSNGAQNNTFIDSSTNNFTITRNGNTTQGSFSPYGSNWSNYFDGTGDYLSVANNTAFQFGTGDFTIEFWINASASGSYTQTIGTLISGTEEGTWRVGNRFNSGNEVFFARGNGSGFDEFRAAVNVNDGAWHHVAVTRSSGTVRIFIDGTLGASSTISGTCTSSNELRMGYNQRDNAYITGYLSNVRILKGTALYTSNFTPSTTPLTAITNTSLLTCAYNRFRDGSTNNFTITRNGDVKVTNFAPFAPSSAYSTTTNGGSIFVDGTGDYLTLASNTNLAPESSAFTWECWFYPNSFVGNTGDGDTLWATTASGGLQIGCDANTANWGVARYGVAWVLQTSTFPTNKMWNHIAIVRSGTGTNQAAIFLNGTRIAQGTLSSSFSAGSTNVLSGNGAAGNSIDGYVSNMRLVKGTAIYDPANSTYTVPTTPLSAVTNTQLLLNATNAAIFDNSMKNDLETVGNAQISTSVKKFGTGSIYCAAATDYLNAPKNDLTAFGTGDFTVECWVRPVATSGGYPCIFSNRDGIASQANCIFFGFKPSTNALLLYTSSEIMGTTTTISSGTWAHVALVRSGSTATIYINGTSAASATFTTNITGTGLSIGNEYNGASLSAGLYFDDFRITKGVARYTANFTAPTAPFPNK